MNMLKLNLHRIRVADGEYANPILNKCLTVYIYISFSDVCMIMLRSLLVQSNLWIDNPSLLCTHRHRQAVTAAGGNKAGLIHVIFINTNTYI